VQLVQERVLGDRDPRRLADQRHPQESRTKSRSCVVLGTPQKLATIEPVSLYGRPSPLSRRRQSARSSRSVNRVLPLGFQRPATESDARTQLTFARGVAGIRAGAQVRRVILLPAAARGAPQPAPEPQPSTRWCFP